ncbi:serine hydrolase [Streptomyces sp. BE20]|uniref:serine hydrolase domain-containing protein n=1 Tax=Streptomyces sp. BE20 TaxID=3002525 RepID=UPI002E786320|nr:serine hydrolase domain-containing protein [Streptomyces sp. BE20]MEE1827852.1 serine hydrolase [Streptomyces sp. BE20]
MTTNSAASSRPPRPAPLRRRTRSAPAVLALAGLLGAAGCSGGTASDPPAAGAVTAVPAALSPSATASSSGPSASASSGGAVVPITSDVTARLDTAVQRVLREASIPGVIVSVSSPGGSYLKAFGVSDKVAGTPMVTGLNMRIGSETKTFTVTGLLKLVDQGKAGLDDPIGTYVSDVPNGDTITLRQLAAMQSGLFSYTQDEEFVQTLEADPDRVFTPQQLLSYAFKHPVNFAPGAKFEYSNTNTVLLGLVIEKLSGQPLGTFLKQQVFEPADLGRTVFPVGSEFPQPHARGYTNQTPNGAIADSTDWDPSWAWAAGAIISDQADLQKWAKVVATGTLLTPQTQAQRLKPQPSTVPDTWYGLGIFYNHGWIGHNGSLPGYQSVVVYLPSAQTSLVVLLNTDVSFQGQEPSTLFAQAVTEIISPANVYTLPAAPAGSGSPSATSSASSASPSKSPSPSSASPSSKSPSPSPKSPSSNADA